MKIQKFIIYGPNNETIGIKRDNITYLTTIGGNGSFLDLIGKIVVHCFGRKLPRPHWISANKVRFTFKSKTGDWDDVRSRLESDGFIINEVTKLARLMR